MKMSGRRVSVAPNVIHAYGDTRGTGVYHRDPKTGAVTNGIRDSKRSTSARSSTNSSNLPPSGQRLRAIDVYDAELEPEVGQWELDQKEELELSLPRIQAEPYKSKFHTTYEPKSHYRFHDSYGTHVEDDPYAKEFVDDEPPSGLPASRSVSPPRFVGSPRPEPRSVSTSPPPKPKKKARSRRPVSPSKVDLESDEDEQREFVGWVMNGKRDDLGISERLLFKRRGP